MSEDCLASLNGVSQISKNSIIPHHPNCPTHSDYDLHKERNPQLSLENFQNDKDILRIGNEKL
jgi:hypothetical protein